jgi:3,4-dihydroxy 2-butanone 4-phosphate synthase / GTP cyclohydrolase II
MVVNADEFGVAPAAEPVRIIRFFSPIRSPVKIDASQSQLLPELIAGLCEVAASVDPHRSELDHPIYGTTLYLAKCDLDTVFGLFHAFIFQDIIHKGYIIALAHGDIRGARQLYTRLHSSCVTSETLRACDCDCVQQLEGAFKVISEKGHGVLFYLMQEGRGSGYVAKARDRMLVQASRDQISTFQAYHLMGLKKDYRNYESVQHICHLLGIEAEFVVLTNNPDKIEGMKAQGLKVARTEALEFEPSPYNLTYLTSKQESGHILNKPSRSSLKRALPPEPVYAFQPYALEKAQRFIYTASYFLPIKPVDNEILLEATQYGALFREKSVEGYMAEPSPFITAYEELRHNRFLIRINKERLKAHREKHGEDPIIDLLTTPYWFQVHVYYDLVTNQEFVVLTHGHPHLGDAPVVRIQSESLFNRFPLKCMDNRAKLKKSIKIIVRYGVGVIVLLYNDGRGAGFGAHAADRMLRELGLTHSSDDSYRRLGVDYDSRDYDAAVRLLKHHVPRNRIQMIVNAPQGLVTKNECASALQDHHVEIQKWLFLEE